MYRKLTYNALKLMPDQIVWVKDNDCAYFRQCRIKIKTICKGATICISGINLISIEDEFRFQFDAQGKPLGEPFEVFVKKGK